MVQLRRLISYLWPVREQRTMGAYQPLTLTWERGRLVVNTDRANQSFGNLHRLWRAVFGHLRSHLDLPSRVLVLGFGAGSVASILHHELGATCLIVGVEGDPAMLDLARRGLGKWDDERVKLIEADAFAWANSTRCEPFDLIVVDLFIDLDVPSAASSSSFHADLARLLAPGGRVLFNTIAHDPESTDRSGRIEAEMRLWTDDLEVFPYFDLNRVFIGRCRSGPHNS
ncbi:MAG: methyltransferase domain-containing protein [Flavobacteriales bacterium]|nr:methyltransferase domain-containing protein [Flavobacteriales bacterium]MCB9193920.1 methyltransferase domain-containing protein [Flavobacteriales bacterium]